MASAKIISTGSGWKLRDEDILLWTSVEYVMLELIKAVTPGQLASLEHVTPSLPEKFGYKRLHRLEKFAMRAKTSSLNAFQRLLGYCSYAVASASTPAIDSLREECRVLLSEPEKAGSIFEKIRAGAPNTEIHVLVKFLSATLGEIRRTSNFAGILMHHRKAYDYPPVRTMHRYGVPVYVCWDNALKLQTYSRYNQHHILNDWAPTLEAFRDVESPPLPTTQTSDPPQLSAQTKYGFPPPGMPTQVFLDPMDYVRQRKIDIQMKLSTSDRKESMRSRQASAMKFGARGRNGPAVYEFERKEEIDQGTGQKIICWERRRLDKEAASTAYECASRSQLWCVLSFLSFSLS